MTRGARLCRGSLALVMVATVASSGCQLATPLPDLKLRRDDGAACDSDNQCESGRCASGICCATGCGEGSWLVHLGGEGTQTVHGVAVDEGGSVFAVGTFNDVMAIGDSGDTLTAAGDADAFVAKLDDSGQHVWSRAYGASGDQRALYVSVTASDVYVAGEHAGAMSFEPYAPMSNEPELDAPSSTDVYVVKLTHDGESNLVVSIGGGDPIAVSGVAAAAGFGVVVLASFVGTISTPPISNVTGAVSLVSRFNPAGDPVGLVQLGDGSQQVHGASVVAADGAGYVVACTVDGELDQSGSYPALGGGDLFVQRKPEIGDTAYARRYGGAGDDVATDSVMIGSEVVIVGELSDSAEFGSFAVGSAGARDAFVVRLDDSGEPLFARSFDAGALLGAQVAVADDGALWVAANTLEQATVGDKTHAPIGAGDVLLIELGPDGELRDSWRFGGSGSVTVEDLGVDGEGRPVIVGKFDGVIELAGGRLESQDGEDGFMARLVP